MAWFKFGSASDKAQADRPVETADTLRQRAKRRLIGSVVLVLAAVGLFPLIFDTQQRPPLIDVPIEIPDKAKVKPLAPPPVAAPVVTPPAPAAKVDSQTSLSGKEELVGSNPVTSPVEPKNNTKVAAATVNTTQSATKTIAKPTVTPPPVAAKEDKAAEQKVASDKAKAEQAAKAAKDAQEAKAAAEQKAALEAQRAKALLEGKPAEKTATPTPSEGAERFIVQFGSFADNNLAREARQKVERAGLKTYAQVAETPQGKRIRVRVGPFATRAEADKAASKIKTLELPAAILTL